MTLLGDYQLLEPLGVGALGAVFRAEHRFLKRSFALKVLSEELAGDPQFVARFSREMEEMGRLEHKNLVKIHNASSVDGKYFLVTDYIAGPAGKGQNLGEYLSAQKTPILEEFAVTLLRQVAEALTYLHNGGIAHLGLKLSNILLFDESLPRIALSDVGLSRVMGQRMLLSRTYEVLSRLLGPETIPATRLHLSFLQHYLFLAPEQKVEGREVGGAADVYAFGVLLYYLLTRTFPEGVFEPIAMKRPDLQLPWDTLVQACLAANPEKRPVSLSDLMVSTLRPLGQTALKKTVSVVTVSQREPPPVCDAVPNTEMVLVRGGSFLRGSVHGARDEVPRHAVTLKSFAIDIHPVTNEQFVPFLTAVGGEKDPGNNDIIRLRESRIKKNVGKFHIESGYGNHPVVGVTWYGATAYAAWSGKRLPTEAEWEVAAYGGAEGFLYPTANDIDRTAANYFSSDTTAVMSYPPNGYGLYDMAGNVYEWCHDWYSYQYYEIAMQEPHNPKGPAQGVYRILRGGCWKSLKEDLRCAHRHRNNPGASNATYGFRLVEERH